MWWITNRAFSLFLIDENKNIILQQRSPKKVMFPLRWSNSVCSHPLYTEEERITQNDEGVRRAARRRLSYELNITHDDLGNMV